MTDFKAGFVIQNFDVSPDGKQIVFDRLRDNSDIVVDESGTVSERRPQGPSPEAFFVVSWQSQA